MRRFKFKMLLAMIGLVVAGNSWGADETTVEIPLKSHIAIVGTGIYESYNAMLMYLNSYAKNGGADAMAFTLDNSFDASKVTSAKLRLYVTQKPTDKNRSGQIRFFSLSEMPTPSETVKGEENAKIYSYGGNNTKRYSFTGTPFTTADHKTSGSTSYMKVDEYNDVDITDYMKGLSDKAAGDVIYIGMDITDFAADTYIGGYGSSNPAKIVVTYSNEEICGYTINYSCGDEVVFAEASSVPKGTAVTSKGIVYDTDGGKYFVESGETTAFTVTENNAIFNVKVRKAYTATINVKTTIDGVSTTDTKTLIEADDNSCKWSYFYSLYAEKDGKYYQCDNNTETFGENGTFTDGQTIDKEVTYSALADDIVFFFEAEKGSGVFGANIGDAKYSGGGYAAAKSENVSNRGQYVGKLGPGKYQFVASIVGNATRHLALRDKASEDRTANIIAEISAGGLQTVEFTLNAEKELVVNGKNTDDQSSKTNQSADFDYAFIKQLEAYIPVEISSAVGYSTFSSTSDVDFSAAEDLTIYTAKINDAKDMVTLTEVADKKVPAGQGVLLKGTGEFTGVVTTGVAAFESNDLIANTEAKTVTREDHIYVLNNVEGIGFYPFAGTLTVGKAHLVIDGGSARAIKIAFGGDTTGITNVENAAAGESKVWHTLSGVRVQNPTKGLYIVDGKKVVVK